MNRTKRIKYILEKNFKDHSIVVFDKSYQHKGHNNFDGTSETHISVKIIKNSKSALNRLAVHRKINSLLSKEFDNGLHSLEIKII
mgnify:CR=1 FL=1